MIKLRMDVDYPYPSRLQSFLFTFLNRKVSSNYLKNAKIIAKMVNESPKEVMAYWFFTPQTLPDDEMLALMRQDKHEAALHIANNPYREMDHIEKITHQKLRYYTIHGTERLFARIMWRRKISQSRVPVPADFPLKNFWDFPTMSLDRVCYANSMEQALKIAEQSVAHGEVLHIHPEWLFQRGTLNHRGPYYETLKTILHSDAELEGLVVRKKGFAKIASYAGIGNYSTREYERDFVPTEEFLEKLADRGVDLFTFLERKWSFNIPNPPKNWVKAENVIALLQVRTYREWWDGIGKKTRNMVRKAEKSGVTTTTVEQDERLVEGIWKIYNATPIRQGRAFPYFGISREIVKAGVLSARGCTFIGAFFQDELVGFIQLVHGDNIAIISQILSLPEFWDKAVNNALVAKAIEVCAAKQVQRVMYGGMGNHPSLDTFKESNNFQRFALTRYYVPLTRKGHITIKLGLHRELKDALPPWLKQPFFPVFNWASRTKMKLRLLLRSHSNAST